MPINLTSIQNPVQNRRLNLGLNSSYAHRFNQKTHLHFMEQYNFICLFNMLYYLFYYKNGVLTRF